MWQRHTGCRPACAAGDQARGLFKSTTVWTTEQVLGHDGLVRPPAPPRPGARCPRGAVQVGWDALAIRKKSGVPSSTSQRVSTPAPRRRRERLSISRCDAASGRGRVDVPHDPVGQQRGPGRRKSNSRSARPVQQRSQAVEGDEPTSTAAHARS